MRRLGVDATDRRQREDLADVSSYGRRAVQFRIVEGRRVVAGLEPARVRLRARAAPPDGARVPEAYQREVEGADAALDRLRRLRRRGARRLVLSDHLPRRVPARLAALGFHLERDLLVVVVVWQQRRAHTRDVTAPFAQKCDAAVDVRALQLDDAAAHRAARTQRVLQLRTQNVRIAAHVS